MVDLLSREYLIDHLRKGVCVVSFTKVNGDKREMFCTLKEGTIPEDKQPSTDSTYSDKVIRAFDVKINEWRSFRVDNVYAFNAGTMVDEMMLNG
jgi:hypothetical protein